MSLDKSTRSAALIALARSGDALQRIDSLEGVASSQYFVFVDSKADLPTASGVSLRFWLTTHITSRPRSI